MLSKFKRQSKRRKITVVLAVLALTLAASAYAAWSFQATNVKGDTRTGEIAPVTFSQATLAGSGTGTFYPGGSASLTLKADNPNAQAVTILTATTPVVTNDNSPACPNSTFSAPASAWIGVVVPPGSNQTITIPNGVTQAITSVTQCQDSGVHVTVPTLTYGFGS